jgi:hypothetical protein
MEIIKKQQRAKIGVAGSFFNQLMSNNCTLPEVGKGATQLHYSDRTCYEVLEVSNDGKTVKLEALDAEWDKTKAGGEGHQNWILKPTGRFCTVVWRNNAWKIQGADITYTKEFKEKHKDVVSYARQLTEEQHNAVYGDDVYPANVVEGITERKTFYHKINIIFGIKDYYYDWEF